MSSKQRGYPSLVGGSNRVSLEPWPTCDGNPETFRSWTPSVAFIACSTVAAVVVERTAVLMSVLELGPPSPPPPRHTSILCMSSHLPWQDDASYSIRDLFIATCSV